MRNISKKCLNLIATFEGFRDKEYLCPAGVKTIGYGHVVLRGESFPQGITRDHGKELLASDVLNAERGVIRLTSVPLSDGQFDALVSFVYNLGSGTYQRSSLRSMVNREEFIDAAGCFGLYVRSAGKILKGLVKRRIAEKYMFLGYN
jgi:lysozyme